MMQDAVVCPKELICHSPLLQVLDSIGVDLNAQLGSVPKTKVAQAQASAADPQESDEDMVQRLAALK